MYMPYKYLGFDYEFKLPVKSARTMRRWAIEVIIGGFLREQNGYWKIPAIRHDQDYHRQNIPGTCQDELLFIKSEISDPEKWLSSLRPVARTAVDCSLHASK